MEILIEKNIEIPTDDTWRAKLDAMEIGDSFSFPRSKRASLASIISNEFHALSNKRFSVSVKQQPDKTARVWRIADNDNE